MHNLSYDFRCSCGKLLFKGLLLNGYLEMKCRYCKKLTAITGLGGGALGDERCVLVVNEAGKILRATTNAPSVFGIEESLLPDKKAHELFTFDKEYFTQQYDLLAAGGAPTVFIQTSRHTPKGPAPVWVTFSLVDFEERRCMALVITRK